MCLSICKVIDCKIEMISHNPIPPFHNFSTSQILLICRCRKHFPNFDSLSHQLSARAEKGDREKKRNRFCYQIQNHSRQNIHKNMEPQKLLLQLNQQLV